MMTVLTLLDPIAARPSTHPDAVLVRRALDGDAAARRTLYTRHAPGAGALAVRLLGHRADGEDALHDAFADAFQRLHQLREPAAFSGWLRRIVVTRVHRQLRRRRLRGLLGLRWARDATLERLASADCTPDRLAELARIDAVLDGLAPQPRICWSLRYIEGCTLPEVAETTGLSLATVKRRIAVARAALATHIGGEGDR